MGSKHENIYTRTLNSRLTTQDWITLNYDKFKSDCLGITRGHELSEELCHYVLTEFLVKPGIQTIIQSGGAYYYLIRMTLNNWNSVTSPFYRQYRQHYAQIETITERAEEIPEDNEPDIEQLAKQVSEQMESLGWYEKNLFIAYVEHNGNASALSKETRIPRTSISLTLKNVKTYLKSRIK